MPTRLRKRGTTIRDPMFNPTVKLDPSQVLDRRVFGPPLPLREGASSSQSIHAPAPTRNRQRTGTSRRRVWPGANGQRNAVKERMKKLKKRSTGRFGVN